MFGTNAFAQTPFAAAGGNVFQVTVSESVQTSETTLAIANFAVSITDTAQIYDANSTGHLVLSTVEELVNINKAKAISHDKRRSTLWINNELNNKMIRSWKDIPQGWVRGRLINIRNLQKEKLK